MQPTVSPGFGRTAGGGASLSAAAAVVLLAAALGVGATALLYQRFAGGVVHAQASSPAQRPMAVATAPGLAGSIVPQPAAARGRRRDDPRRLVPRFLIRRPLRAFARSPSGSRESGSRCFTPTLTSAVRDAGNASSQGPTLIQWLHGATSRDCRARLGRAVCDWSPPGLRPGPWNSEPDSGCAAAQVNPARRCGTGRPAETRRFRAGLARLSTFASWKHPALIENTGSVRRGRGRPWVRRSLARHLSAGSISAPEAGGCRAGSHPLAQPRRASARARLRAHRLPRRNCAAPPVPAKASPQPAPSVVTRPPAVASACGATTSRRFGHGAGNSVTVERRPATTGPAVRPPVTRPSHHARRRLLLNRRALSTAAAVPSAATSHPRVFTCDATAAGCRRDRAGSSARADIAAGRPLRPALYLQRIGDFDNAITHYRALLEQNDASAEVHNNLGLLYQDRGQLDDAMKQFQRAIAIDPRYVKAHNNLGVAFMRSSRPERPPPSSASRWPPSPATSSRS